MSSFLKTLISVLQDAPEIPELPSNKLIIVDDEGAVSLKYAAAPFLLLKLARLQTLIVRESERGKLPDLEEIKRFGKNVAPAMANSLVIQEDSNTRVMMLERIVVEVVREAFPRECERLDVDYLLHPTKGI